MRRLVLLGVAAALLASRTAHGDQPITTNQNFQNFHIYHLGDPTTAADVPTAPIRVQELSLGSCLLKVAGSLPYHCGVAGTDYQAPLSAADATLVFPTATTVRVRNIGAYSIWGNPNGSGGIATDIGPATVAGQVPTFTGSSISWSLPAAASGTPNTVPFFNGSGTLAEAANALGYDPTNVRLGSRVSSGLPLFQLHLVDESGATDRGIVIETDVASTAGARIVLRSSGGSYVSPAAVANTKYAGVVEFQPHDGTQFLHVGQTGVHLINGATVATNSVPSEWFLSLDQRGVADPFSAGNPFPLQAQTFPTSARGFVSSVAIGAQPGTLLSSLTALAVIGKGVAGFGHSGRIVLSNTTVGSDQGVTFSMQNDVSTASLNYTSSTSSAPEGTNAVALSSATLGNSVWLEPSGHLTFEAVNDTAIGDFTVGAIRVHANQTGGTSSGGTQASLELLNNVAQANVTKAAFLTAVGNSNTIVGNSYLAMGNPQGRIGFYVGQSSVFTGTPLTPTFYFDYSASGVASTVQGSGAAIGRSATDGFFYLASMAGTPTGTPTAQGSSVPATFDTTDNAFAFYSGAAWRFSLNDPGSNGIVARTALGATAARTLTNGDGTIGFSNPDGVAGNPEIHVAAIPESKVTNLVTDLAGKQAVGDYATSGTGPVSWSAHAGGGGVTTAINFGAGGISGQAPLANQAAPTGTGFVHDTAGAWDSAARAVDLSGADVTSQLKAASFPAMSGPVTTPGGSLTDQLNLGAGGISGTLGLTFEAAPAGTGIATTFGGAWNTSALTLTNGSVAYWNGTLAEDNARFFWDFTNHRLGLGTNAPAELLTVNGLAAFGTHVTAAQAQLGTLDDTATASNAFVYPDGGTNVGASLSAIPRGTGASSTDKSAMLVWNTDYRANQTDFELMKVHAAGTSGFEIFTTAGGAGTLRPLTLRTGTNAGQLVLNTDGTVSIPSLETQLIDVTQTAAPSAPGAGHTLVWSDLTNGGLWTNTSGFPSHTVSSLPATTNMVLTGLADNGQLSTRTLAALATSGAASDLGSVPTGILAGASSALTTVTIAANTGIGYTGTTLSGVAFGAAGGAHAQGMVPDPGSGSDSSKYLRDDGSWTTPVSATWSYNYENRAIISGFLGHWAVAGPQNGDEANGAAYEYTTGFVAQHVRVIANITCNTLSATGYSPVTFQVTRNAANVTGATVSIPSSSAGCSNPGVVYDSGPIAVAGASFSDTYGVLPSGSNTGGGSFTGSVVLVVY